VIGLVRPDHVVDAGISGDLAVLGALEALHAAEHERLADLEFDGLLGVPVHLAPVHLRDRFTVREGDLEHFLLSEELEVHRSCRGRAQRQAGAAGAGEIIC
jgi:hypothetical protein